MISRILSNLGRQERAVTLLGNLLEEEFACLSSRDPKAVASIEFSIQELLRQLAVERVSLHGHYKTLDPAAKRLADVIGRFPAEAAQQAARLYRAIDLAEQRCAKRAEQNYAMALGLFDVTRSCLDNLQKQLVPKKGVYGARGRMASTTPPPGILSGRL